MLKGARVELRPIKRSDIEYFLKWMNDTEVSQYLTVYLPVTEFTEEKWIEDMAQKTAAGSDVIFVIEALDDGHKSIGVVGLDKISPKDHQAEFGIAIGEKSHWEKGYGTEAARLIIDYGFQQLNLHRIRSGALANNKRSIRLHKKVGFQEEGRLREEVFKNGEFHDLVIFGLLRDEWKSGKKVE